MNHRRDQRPDPATYRPATGLTAAQRTAEQDTAAGGRRSRLITRVDGGVVAASVALRSFPQSRGIYAYLRWSASSSGTAERYLGDVSDCPTRDVALRVAWQRALQHGTSRPRSDTDAPAHV